jgi:hypothetical protein
MSVYHHSGDPLHTRLQGKDPQRAMFALVGNKA